jgi:peptidoglycan/xylan/chitin deacetylase (PgdA/CDA1 family)
MLGTLRRRAKAVAEAVLPSSIVVWRGREQRSRVALTFDDGPGPLTMDYLDVLERLDARATFFLVGELCERYPELVRAIAERGHELANHGYTHRPFPKLGGRELSSELERTQALLPSLRRGRALVRPPYGAVSPASLLTCARRGFTTVMWSVNSGDWARHDPDEVARTFKGESAAGGDIVLLHEGQPWTMKALPTIVGELKKAGHELVTVSELLA